MRQPTWIILDDDTQVRNLMKGMCLVWEIEAIELQDGFQAMVLLDRVRGGEYRGPTPEVALLDLRLPGPDGGEVARRMRELPFFDETVIILVTAYTLQESEREALMESSQADLFIHKPLPPLMDFNRQIQQLIQEKKQAPNRA